MAWLVALAVALGPLTTPARTEAQIFKRTLQAAACIGGGAAGLKAGEKMAEFEARKLNLSPEQARQHRRAFQIGMALALCGVGAAVVGTTYSRMSKRGEENRKREMEAAVADAQPRTYSDPERPALNGSIQVQPSIVDGSKECRTVEDVLADGQQSDRALVKYCRSDGGEWKVDRI